MGVMSLAALLLLVTHLAADVALANKLNEDIYTSLTVDAVSRLLDTDGMIGASSGERGNVGALYKIESANDVAGYQSAPDRPYIVLIDQDMLGYRQDGKNIVQILKEAGNTEGLLVYNTNGSTPFSAGDLVPNSKYGIPFKGTNQWNGQYGGGFGDDNELGMHWVDLGVPMFALTEEDTVKVMKLFDQNNNPSDQNSADYPLAGAKLEFFMWAAPNAQTCLRRLFCDPLGSQNLLGFLRPYKNDEDAVIVSAANDAVSMFHDNCWGADAQGAAIVATIAAAGVVGQVPQSTREDNTIFDKNIMFSIFGGEHFGYIGSSSFGNRLLDGTVPAARSGMMNEDNIKYFIELDQLAYGKGDQTFFMHTDEDGSSDASQEVTDAIKATTNGGMFQDSSESEMPPSSYRGLFSELSNARSKVGATVVSKYDTSYKNPYFETRIDNAAHMGITAETSDDDELVVNICNLATSIGQASLTLASSGNYDASALTANCTYVRQLLQVLLVNSSMAAGDLGEGFLRGDGPLNRYVGVFRPGQMGVANYYIYYQLASALAVDKVVMDSTSETCGTVRDGRTGTFGGSEYIGATRYNSVPYTSDNDDGTILCINSTASWMDALSPAFDDDLTLASGSKRDGKRWSTWVESTWYAGDIQVFLIADPNIDNAALGGGIAYLLMSFALVFFFQRKVEFVSEAISNNSGESARPM